MSRPPGILKRTWFKWKALRLPWRKQWLAGADLSGNTFWEFKDALNANRLRRIAKSPSTTHYADVNISPQWHQWLRHTREAPPSIHEQQFEVSRQARMKQLAFEADERWRSIPSYLDSPDRQQPRPAIGVNHPAENTQQLEPEEEQDGWSVLERQDKLENIPRSRPQDAGRSRAKTGEKKPQENPWQDLRLKGAPSENWQPESWTPGIAQRQR